VDEEGRIIGIDRILLWAILCLVLSASLQACTSSPVDKDPEPSSEPTIEPKGVTLVLVATQAPSGCCRVFTMNPGQTAITVICTFLALDPAGRIVYSGFIPGSPPGHRRPSGFDAPPGRHGHGVFQLPIDLARDSYTAPCRPAAWHGGTAI
jgi:hypothetical protein